MPREPEIITQITDTADVSVPGVRVGCRGLIVQDGKILLSHEKKRGTYMTPGGGLEQGETLEDCCRRELSEESGYIVNVGDLLFTVDEFVGGREYLSHYFLCEIIGECERVLTPFEIEGGLEPCRMELDEAIKIFSNRADCNLNKASMYMREHTVLTRLKRLLAESK